MKAGILASLQDTSEDPEGRVEVPKSSVSSLRQVIIMTGLLFLIFIYGNTKLMTMSLYCLFGFNNVSLKEMLFSHRLQQLERMGFPTEKAVVALAASKQLDGAISLLIDNRVGDQSVMVSKGRGTPSP